MYSDVDDVRNTGDIYRLSGDSEKGFTDSAEMAEVPAVNGGDAASADDGGCDFVSKPTTAPLSSRASAFSIAALMKDRDADTASAASLGGGQRQTDTDARLHAVASLYDLATDGWRQQVRNFSGGAEVVSAKTDAADYWATLSNASQRRMYIMSMM